MVDDLERSRLKGTGHGGESSQSINEGYVAIVLQSGRPDHLFVIVMVL